MNAKQLYIYYMNGLHPATADAPMMHKSGAYRTVTVRADDVKLTMIVTEGTYIHKLEDDKPTFYAC